MASHATDIDAPSAKRHKIDANDAPAASGAAVDGSSGEAAASLSASASSAIPASSALVSSSTTPAAPAPSPSALFGLYSTDYPDYCSGCWFPVRYVGPVPPAGAAGAAGGSAADATAAGGATGAGSTPMSVAAGDSGEVLVRWSSQKRRYAPEPLSLMFIRSSAEFEPLPLSAQKRGKRVLVRDVLVDMDFEGESYWLATLDSEPSVGGSGASKGGKSKGKKRSSSSANEGPTVSVVYQNEMWPPALVPASAIFVLPKQKAPLTLVPDTTAPADVEEEEESEEEEEEAGEEAEQAEEPVAAASNIALPFAHGSPRLQSSDDAEADPFAPSSPVFAPLSADTEADDAL